MFFDLFSLGKSQAFLQNRAIDRTEHLRGEQRFAATCGNPSGNYSGGEPPMDANRRESEAEQGISRQFQGSLSRALASIRG